MEVVLRAVLDNDRLRVTEVITQQGVPNLYGRAVRFDALATDGENIYDVEIQRSDEGAIPRRARFNSSMIDSREVSKGTLFLDLPETYVIFGSAVSRSTRCAEPSRIRRMPSMTAHISLCEWRMSERRPIGSIDARLFLHQSE